MSANENNANTREQLSALMDGDLSRDETRFLLRRLDADTDLARSWSHYQIASDVLNTLSGSFQVTPMFFLNWNNMVAYNIVAQTPQYQMDTMQDLRNIPINRATRSTPAAGASRVADDG